jgi:hypothetical protein
MATRKPRKNKPTVFDDENYNNGIRENEINNATEINEDMADKEYTEYEKSVSYNNKNSEQDSEIDKNELGTEFNPLEGEVKKRAYASNFGAQNTVQEVERVPEPSITNLPPPPPPTNEESSPFMGGDNNNSSGKGSSATTPPQQQKLNPDMVSMPDKDARVASTMLVDAILGGYKQFWGIAYERVKVSDEQIVDWVMNDEISLDIKIPINQNGDESDLRSVYEMFNAQSKEALTVDLTTDDFIKVREAMIREFTRRGWGISDMQYIIQHFVRDAGQRGISIYQLRGTINNFTKSIMNTHAETKRLREELTKIKEKVEASEPTKIKQDSTNKVVKESREKTMEDASDFVERYEIKRGVKKETEVREVPFYDGNRDIQAEKKEEENTTDVAIYDSENID